MDLLWFIENSTTSEPVSGSSDYTSLSIRRATDGYLLNWSTNVFESSGGSNPTIKYGEIFVLPGLYTKSVNTSTWVDGIYHAISYLNTPLLFANRMIELIIGDGEVYESTIDLTLLDKLKDTPAATLLVQEYYNNEDSDGNGLIYGVDFYISTDRPKILDGVPKRGTAMTWTAYLASI